MGVYDTGAIYVGCTKHQVTNKLVLYDRKYLITILYLSINLVIEYLQMPTGWMI